MKGEALITKIEGEGKLAMASEGGVKVSKTVFLWLVRDFFKKHYFRFRKSFKLSIS